MLQLVQDRGDFIKVIFDARRSGLPAFSICTYCSQAPCHLQPVLSTMTQKVICLDRWVLLCTANRRRSSARMRKLRLVMATRSTWSPGCQVIAATLSTCAVLLALTDILLRAPAPFRALLPAMLCRRFSVQPGTCTGCADASSTRVRKDRHMAVQD